MPLRMLMYVARVYEVIVENDNIYRKPRITIPKPEFYVVYNGVDEYPDSDVLRLSDAFAKIPETAGRLQDMGGILELEVSVINVNAGHSEAIVNKSEHLSGYSIYVGKVREYQSEGRALEEAVRKAAEYCISHSILTQEFSNLTSEV